jgi:hypothetical protein
VSLIAGYFSGSRRLGAATIRWWLLENDGWSSDWLQPARAAQSRVIAVDGFDSQAAQAIIKYLEESIRRHTNLRVRVFGPLICPAVPKSDWFHYTRYINQWNDLWQFLIVECSDQGGRSQSSTAFCVNIVPFSPL